MFESMEQVPWQRLRQAHGTAEHVPAALRGLAAASDKAEAEQHYWRIDNYVVLQGTLYESGYYVIPFLVELLEQGAVPAKEATYDLLNEIAWGTAVEDGLTVADRTGKSLPLEEAKRVELAKARRFAQADLSDTDPAVACAALNLLGYLEEPAELLSRLRPLLSEDLDPKFREELAGWIRSLEHTLARQSGSDG